MYIFRWLMKHPVIILALYFLSIVAILFSMTRGGPTNEKAEITEAVNVVETSSEAVDVSKAPSIEPSTLTSALVNGESETEEAETKVEEAADTVVAIEEKPEVAGTEVEANVETDTAAVVEEAITAETETQFSESSAEELLLMAREAYWNNGLEESAEIYQQLIQANPDVIDYKGELGNVFWRQGFPKKAAELYAEISLPMIEAGSADKVANMVGFIGLFFPEKATEIHNKLQADK